VETERKYTTAIPHNVSTPPPSSLPKKRGKKRERSTRTLFPDERIPRDKYHDIAICKNILE